MQKNNPLNIKPIYQYLIPYSIWSCEETRDKYLESIQKNAEKLQDDYYIEAVYNSDVDSTDVITKIYNPVNYINTPKPILVVSVPMTTSNMDGELTLTEIAENWVKTQSQYSELSKDYHIIVEVDLVNSQVTHRILSPIEVNYQNCNFTNEQRESNQ